MCCRQSLSVAVITLCGVAAGWAQERGESPRTGRQPASRSAQPPAVAPPQATSPQTAAPHSGVANPTVARFPPSGHQTPALVRASQIVGLEVRDSSGQARIGQIADLLLTPGSRGPTNVFQPLNGTNTGANPVPAPRTRTGGPAGANANSLAGASGDTAATAPTSWWRNSDCDLRFALIQVDNATAERVLILPWELLHFQGTYFTLGLDTGRLTEAPSVMLNDPRILQSQEWLEQIGMFYANDLQRTQARPEALAPESPATQSPQTRRSPATAAPPRRN